NASDVPWIAAMREAARLKPPGTTARSGQAVYAAACASCHGVDRRGNDRAPSLVAVGSRLTLDVVAQVIEHGRGFMPSFARLPELEKQALLAYLFNRAAPSLEGAALPRSDSRPVSATGVARPPDSPYEFVGYERWRDSSGYPAIRPPWGTLSAIDLNTGKYRWRIPLGEHKSLTARGIPATGTEQYGGPIVTAGGLLFIAATMDEKFRAFDKATGELLWQTELPA